MHSNKMDDINAVSSNFNNNTNMNMNMDSNNSDDMVRQSESPARTIDSHDSTVDSMDTIVDRSVNREELMHAAIEQSLNTTNAQHDSLTNSQKSILQRNSSGCSDTDDHQQQQHSPQKQQLQADTQSHIYSSPVYDQKPPLKLTAATLVASVAANNVGNGKSVDGDDAKKPKLMTHEEFQQQLQAAIASRANTLDSRISKKQRFPPELIKIKDGDGSSSNSAKAAKFQRRAKSSADCCSAFPWQIVLGTLQLMLAITLVALGSLLIVREAALSTAGCGIWTGLVAAITGSLGVVSIRKTQTAFLALSLICIATSTLALAVSGVGLSRDVNRMEEKFDLLNANSEISAASGLILALFLHFVVSIVSVYRCALQICSRNESTDLRDVIINSKTGGVALDQEKVDQYIKAMSLTGSEKENAEKLAAMWMYAAQMGSSRNLAQTGGNRPIMLIPAGSTTMLATPPPVPPMPGAMVVPGIPYRPPMAYTLPYMRPGSVVYAPTGSAPSGTYRTQKSRKSVGPPNRRRRPGTPPLRAGKMDANRHQRCKSDTDVSRAVM
uniref:Transmembrane protein 176B n=1 Tax=Bactrocera dorsalis TaxID=27457 RepID=A0A034VKR3_BACDO